MNGYKCEFTAKSLEKLDRPLQCDAFPKISFFLSRTKIFDRGLLVFWLSHFFPLQASSARTVTHDWVMCINQCEWLIRNVYTYEYVFHSFLFFLRKKKTVVSCHNALLKNVSSWLSQRIYFSFQFCLLDVLVSDQQVVTTQHHASCSIPVFSYSSFPNHSISFSCSTRESSSGNPISNTACSNTV